MSDNTRFPEDEVMSPEDQAAYDKVFYEGEDPEPEENLGDEEIDAEDNDTEVEKTEDVEAEEPKADEVSENPADDATPDEPLAEVEEKPEDEPEEKPESKETKTIRWKGKDVEVTMDELISMAQQGFDYTYKSQHLADDKRSHQAELTLLKKVKEGDKEALAQLSKQSGIDPLDLLDIDVDDIEQGAAKPAAPFMSPEVEQLMGEVQKDSELYGKMQFIEDSLPSSVIDVMAKDAGTFYSIVDEVRNGSAEVVLPQVTARLATLPELDRALVMNNPEQYAQFYMMVKQSLYSKEPETTQKPESKRVKPNPAEVGIKRSEVGRGGKQVAKDSYSSDETYAAILNRLENQ